MKLLVIGSGAREHALVWKLKQSKRVTEIFVAPGNAGTSEIAKNVNLKANDLEGLLAFSKSEKIDITVVGPEGPLVLGIVDLFQKAGLKIFGPDSHGAKFEGSKAFSKAFMQGNNIPTAQYREFTNLKAAKEDVAVFGFPLVIKADGLAAGKGVVICKDVDHALKTLDEIMGDKIFGEAGNKVVFEEFLTGIEASVLCFVDGQSIVPMASAQDYKKAYDNDEGQNTGGMGAYSPSRLFTPELEKHIDEKVLQPFLKGTQAEGIDYRGIIFIGLMIENDEVKVIEFNCRMGDPETQVVLPRMKTDLLEVIEACINSTLDQLSLEWEDFSTVGIVIASGGYPDKYEKNKVITGIKDVSSSLVFHAGTVEKNGQVQTTGGRVLSVVSIADDIETARKQAYDNVKKIKFDQMMYRNDIANPQ